MIEIILIIGVITFTILVLFIIGGVTVYDIQDIQARQLFKKHPFARRYRNRPVVTVLLVADQEIESARQCIENLKASHYRRLEIIVIDTVANSKLRRLTTAHGTRARPIRLFKSIRSEQAAINTAYRRYGHGDIVAILRAADMLDPAAIRQAVWHFNTRENISALYTHKVMNSTYNSAGLFQTYIESLLRLSNKLMSTFSLTHSYNSYVPIFYRRDAFLHRYAQDITRSHFADDVISYHQPALLSPQLMRQSFLTKARQLQSAGHQPHHSKTSLFSRYIQHSWKLYIGILLISTPPLFSYFIFLALVPHQPLFLLLCAGLTSLFLLFGIWSDQQYPLSKKLLNSLLIPTSFIPLLLLVFVQLGLYIAALSKLLWTAMLKLLPNKKTRNAYGYD